MPDSPASETALVTVGTQPVSATRDNVSVMDRFVATMDPQADPKARWALAVVACRLGLHPLNNEVILYERKPYITITGLRRLAERSHDLAAVQPFIITEEQERVDLGVTLPGDVVAGCKLYRRSSELPTIQYGIVRQHERWPSKNELEKMGITKAQADELRAANNPDGIFALIKSDNPPKVRPVILQPQTMAMKRAEARALSSLAGVPLPTYDTELGGPVTATVTPPQLLRADDGSGPPADYPDGAAQADADRSEPQLPAASEKPWQPGEGPVPPAQEADDPGPEEPQAAALQGTPLGEAAQAGSRKAV